MTIALSRTGNTLLRMQAATQVLQAARHADQLPQTEAKTSDA